MHSKPHISFLLSDILNGGGDRVVVNLSNQFIDRGYAVTIVSMGFPRAKMFALNEKVRVEYLQLLDTRQSKVKKVAVRLKAICAVRKAFSRMEKPVFIFGVGPLSNLLISLLPRKKGYVTIGCDHCSYHAIGKRIVPLLRRWFYPRLSAFISLTKSDEKFVKQNNACTGVIPNSVSFYPDRPAQLVSKVVLAVGRLSHQKGLDLLLDIFEQIGADIPGWRLRIVGDGPEKEALVSRVKKSQLLSAVVDIAGENLQVQEEYKNASVYVMTSQAEGLPMVLLEAQAYGLPIVSFDCRTGPSDIVTDGENGFLIPCFDKKMMGEKIVALCNDASLRQKFGSNARQSVKRFLPETVVRQWENLFEKLTN
jgi:glycosyltransferase involved in cell wall biosynthesis